MQPFISASICICRECAYRDNRVALRHRFNACLLLNFVNLCYIAPFFFFGK